jgi:hypothetical protein
MLQETKPFIFIPYEKLLAEMRKLEMDNQQELPKEAEFELIVGDDGVDDKSSAISTLNYQTHVSLPLPGKNSFRSEKKNLLMVQQYLLWWKSEI